MTKKETLQLLRTIASCAQRAADHTGRNREFAELRDVIARQERQHRAMGKRMVGDIGARMTVAQSVDYFVCKTLSEGHTLACREAPIRALSGIREDFVRAAILMSEARFRNDFLSRVREAFPGEKATAAAWKAVEEADYCEFIGGK